MVDRQGFEKFPAGNSSIGSWIDGDPNSIWCPSSDMEELVMRYSWRTLKRDELLKLYEQLSKSSGEIHSFDAGSDGALLYITFLYTYAIQTWFQLVTGWDLGISTTTVYHTYETGTWMSVPAISAERGGGGTTFSTRSSFSTSRSIQLNFTATVTLPFPPPGSTTLTSFVTLSPTSTTISTTTTTSSNFISTTTAISLSITPLPNPAATAAIAAQSSLLEQNEALSRANFTSTLVLGSVSFVLLLLLLIIFLIYIRKRILNTDSESPPFTSLAPRPAPIFGPPSSPPPQSPLPEHMRETSLSMGPRGGIGGFSTSQYPSISTAGQDPRSFQFGFPFPTGSARSISGFRSQALTSHPLSPPSPPRPLRSSSAPTLAPEPAPSIPPFTDIGVRPPRISLYPATPFTRSRDSVNTRPATGTGTTASDTTFGTPLRRQKSAPMYHRALREQAEKEREESRSREAVRLGVPVIGVAPRQTGSTGEGEQRKSIESEISSSLSFGSENVETGILSPADDEDEDGEEPETEFSGGQLHRQRFAGGITGGNSGQGSGERGRPLHSTRASSGVFPEGREGEDDEEKGKEKGVYS